MTTEETIRKLTNELNDTLLYIDNLIINKRLAVLKIERKIKELQSTISVPEQVKYECPPMTAIQGKRKNYRDQLYTSLIPKRRYGYYHDRTRFSELYDERKKLCRILMKEFDDYHEYTPTKDEMKYSSFGAYDKILKK